MGACAGRRAGADPAYLLMLGSLILIGGSLVDVFGSGGLLAMVDETPAFGRDVLLGTTIFALGLAIVVAPLTAAILADADESTSDALGTAMPESPRASAR